MPVLLQAEQSRRIRCRDARKFVRIHASDLAYRPRNMDNIGRLIPATAFWDWRKIGAIGLNQNPVQRHNTRGLTN